MIPKTRHVCFITGYWDRKLPIWNRPIWTDFCWKMKDCLISTSSVSSGNLPSKNGLILFRFVCLWQSVSICILLLKADCWDEKVRRAGLAPPSGKASSLVDYVLRGTRIYSWRECDGMGICKFYSDIVPMYNIYIYTYCYMHFEAVFKEIFVVSILSLQGVTRVLHWLVNVHGYMSGNTKSYSFSIPALDCATQRKIW